ncbi:MAG: hypothetical protein ACLRNV_04695 [Flavonifractor plautii]
MVTLRSRFLPEGRLLHTPENEAACASRDGLRRAMEEETVLEGVAQLCDGAHNLLVSVGPFTGFLPREEAALGIAEGTTREIAILSRVGKPVCFQITALEESEGVLRPRLPPPGPAGRPGRHACRAASRLYPPGCGHPPGVLRGLCGHRLRRSS